MASRIVSSNPWPQRTPHYASPKPTSFIYSYEDQPLHSPFGDEDDSVYDSDSYDNRPYPPPTFFHYKRHPFSKRQTADAASVTSNDCGLVPNNVITCFPNPDSIVIQGIASRIVWNQHLPIFSQTEIIDVHLFHGDTDDPVLTWVSQQYQLGHLAFIPNDTWWGDKGPLIQPEMNQTQSFFFVLVPNGGDVLSGVSQATFTATQTGLPTSILSSIAFVSSASALSVSLASVSSASLSSLQSQEAGTRTTITSSPTSGSLQGNSSGSNSFPNWAIALLAVFGFLAFLSLICVLFLLFRGLKRKDRGLYERASTGGELKYRGSVGSNTPMIPRNTTTDPEAAFRDGLPTGASSAGIAAGGVTGGNTGQNLSSSAAMAGNPTSDNGSTISHADSAYAAGVPPLTAGHPPFSLADASALGLAFRNVMRKPDFPDVDEVDADSPGMRQSVVDDDAGREFMESELAEEGRDIRSVSSSRGVKVETVDSSTV